MKKRLAFIDLLRGWSLIVMIEVHIFNSMLLPYLKGTSWFDKLNFINGLVAPAFLFISGFSFYLSSLRKMEEFRKFKYLFWRQIGRISMIWVIGYLLHLPYLSLSRTMKEATSNQLSLFISVDILQCIAVGLLLLFILRIVITNDKVFNAILLTLSILIIIISPYMWSIDFSTYLPVAAVNYLNPLHGSLFPLFPWLGFMWLGAVFSSFYVKNSAENEKNFLNKTLILGLILSLAGIIVLYLPIELLHDLSKIKPNPFFFSLRLGLIILLLIFLRYYEIKRKTEKSFVLLMGRESLLVYWLHLQVIYRQFYEEKSLNSLFGQSFNVFQTIIATIILIMLMAAAAKGWEIIKLRYKKVAQIIVVGTMTVILIVFFLR